jgi:hypothetical protein
LTPSQRAVAAKISRELIRRREQERIREFVATEPPYNDQRGFLYSTAKERWVFGGNRSGKTEVGVADCIMLCTGTHPVRSVLYPTPVKVRYIGKSWTRGVDIIIEKFKAMVKRSDLEGKSWSSAFSEQKHQLFFANGSWVKFLTSEQDVDKHGGDDLDAVYLDEHHERKFYDEAIMRLVDRNGYLVSTMTPELGITWEEDHVVDPANTDVAHWFFDTEHNPYLSVEGVEAVKKQIKDPVLAEAKLHGRFVPLTGLVIPQFNPTKHIIPDRQLHPNAQRVFCIDLHLKTPSAAMWAAWEPDDKYGQRLIVYRTAKKMLSVPEWKQYIRAKSAGEKITLWLGDESERETAAPNIYGSDSIVADFNKGENPIPLVQATKGVGSFEASVFRLRDWFSLDPVDDRCRIYIFASCDYANEYIAGKPCGSLPWELKRFSFKAEHKADEETLRENVRTINDHLISDLRYIVQADSAASSNITIISGLANAWS